MAYTTGDDNYGVTSYIVDPTAGNGNYTTIATALTAASAASFTGDIFIRPGTYTENPTLIAGVNLVAWPSDATAGTVIINGNCTLSTAGTVTISGIELQTNSANCITVSGSVASVLYLTGCNINCLNHTGISYSSSSASSAVRLYNCTGNLSTTGIGLYANTGAGTFEADYTIVTNTAGSTTASTMAGGTFNTSFCLFAFPNTLSSTTSGTWYCTKVDNTFTNAIAITTSGTAFLNIISCSFATGSASSVSSGSGSTINAYNCSFFNSNTDAITGAGTLVTIGCTYTGSSHLNNATTTTGSGAASGLTNGVAPAAGMIGEQIRATVAVGSPVGFTTAQIKNITSINLTAGIWDVSINVAIQDSAGSGNATNWAAGMSTTTGALSTNFSDDQAQSVSLPVNTASASFIGVAAFRYTLSATTPVFMVGGISAFTLGTYSMYGRISATRVG